MYDILIKDSFILDGTGNPGYKADIGVKDGKISKIQNYIKNQLGDVIIDGKTLYSCPGFIDLHSHGDWGYFTYPKFDSAIRQGITTICTGNCGSSDAPNIFHNLKEYQQISFAKMHSQPTFPYSIIFSEYMELVKKTKITGNVANFLGHGNIRYTVMENQARKPSDTEMTEMELLVEDAMKAGAFGMTSGLLYVPGIFSSKREIWNLAKIVAKYHGIYASHIRSMGKGLFSALEEVLEVGRQTGVRTIVSHVSIFTRDQFGKSPDVLEILEKEREKGYDVWSDMHPYDSVHTTLGAIFPPWIFDGGQFQIEKRLGDPETRKKIITQMKTGLDNWEEWLSPADRPWENMVLGFPPNLKNCAFNGQIVANVAKNVGKDPYELVCDFLEGDGIEVQIVIKQMRSQEDILNFMKSPFIAFETDSSIHDVEGFGKTEYCHPREFGTYPKILGEFVREKKILPWEDAIRKMTSLPAQILGIHDRGLIYPGAWADVVLFDPTTIIDTATYQNPYQFPLGIKKVMVNGHLVSVSGKHQNLFPGQVLQRN